MCINTTPVDIIYLSMIVQSCSKLMTILQKGVIMHWKLNHKALVHNV